VKFWKDTKNHSKHFLRKNIWYLKERKNALESSDQDQSTFSSRTIFLNCYWSFDLTETVSSLIWSSN